MTRDNVQKLKPGLYRVHWSEYSGGGESLAAVGLKYNGDRWLCCTNWTSNEEKGTDAHGKIWESVESICFLIGN